MLKENIFPFKKERNDPTTTTTKNSDNHSSRKNKEAQETLHAFFIPNPS